MPISALEHDDDEMLTIESVNVGDETALQRIVDGVNNILSLEQPVRVTMLTDEQWKHMIEHHPQIPARNRKAASSYLHVLPDLQHPHHLMVSRQTAAGINERQPNMYAEVVYMLVRSAGAKTPPLIVNGLNDLVAAICSRQFGVAFFTNNYPAESAFAGGLISCLQRQWGHETDEWVLLAKRDPAPLWLMVKRSQWASFWVACAKRNPQLEPELRMLEPAEQRQWLIDRLLQPNITFEDSFVRFTTHCIRQYHEYLDSKEDR